MKAINKEVLKDAASRLMFDMSEEQYDTLEKEFDIMIKQMKLIGEIPGVDEVEPMTFPFDVATDYLREDEVEETLSKDEVLKNAKDVVDGQIKLPKVVG
ncbi:MAG: Asp-tRNA(Asn)/Glu-tRNA(Gln) amidotransferase subunit GatC [Erysipelotrichales bacterium]|nr:Asp-tRNA(Asn)/Glu-tRNA(Gln) amidotransferase subunit GatC [Erysipelotrichales bacterium]